MSKKLRKTKGLLFVWFLSQPLFLLLTLTRTAIFSLRATETTKGREIDQITIKTAPDPGSNDQIEDHSLCLPSLTSTFRLPLRRVARFRQKEIKTGCLVKFEFQIKNHILVYISCNIWDVFHGHIPYVVCPIQFIALVLFSCGFHIQI